MSDQIRDITLLYHTRIRRNEVSAYDITRWKTLKHFVRVGYFHKGDNVIVVKCSDVKDLHAFYTVISQKFGLVVVGAHWLDRVDDE